MTPLDLTETPPRSARERLDGLVFMARTVDKMRACLPGGKLGEYRVQGTSTQVLQAIGVRQEELQDVVARASSEDEITRWLHEHANVAAYEQINNDLGGARLADMGSDRFFERYPFARDMPPETPYFDVLDRDDREIFQAP